MSSQEETSPRRRSRRLNEKQDQEQNQEILKGINVEEQRAIIEDIGRKTSQTSKKRTPTSDEQAVILN